MWEQLHSTIEALVWQGIQNFDACDTADKETLAYAFLKDLAYEVNEYIRDSNLLDAMEETATIADGLVLFWQTIAALDYAELKQRYLNPDFEWQLEDTCFDIFNVQVADYLAEQTGINRCAEDNSWMWGML